MASTDPKPYTAADTAEILKTAVYFDNHPQGELVQRMAAQLRAADHEINSAGSRAFQAELRLEKSEKAQRELEQSVVRLRGDLAAALAKVPEDKGGDCI